MFNVPLEPTPEDQAKIQSSFVRRSLTAVDYVRQHTTQEFEGAIAGQLQMTDAFVSRLEAIVGIGFTVQTTAGPLVVTRDDVKEGVGENRFNELVQIISLFRHALVKLGFSPLPVVTSVAIGSSEPVAIVKQAETNVPGIGKNKSVTVQKTKLPPELSKLPPDKKNAP